MKYIINSLIILNLSLFISLVHAVTIQKCVDENNETTYQKICPPDSTSANTLKLQSGKSSGTSDPLDPTLSNIKITLYAVPDCEACDLSRQILEKL